MHTYRTVIFAYQQFIFHRTVATQLRCGGIFNNDVIAYFPQYVPCKRVVKIGNYLAKISAKAVGLLSWPTLYF